MTLDSSVLRHIESQLAAAYSAQSVVITGVQKLSGGAIQENWELSADVAGGCAPGLLQWVLRKDSAAVVASSRSRLEQAALLSIVYGCGIRAPRPLLVDDGTSVGFPFFVMEKLPGLAQGHLLTRDEGLVPNRQALMQDMGAQMALLHAIEPPQAELGFLGTPAQNPLLARLASLRGQLDALGEAQPALEAALRWCERHAPASVSPTLVHGDWRTGNLMIHEGRLAGVLDWEFAGWGDPREDLGWFAARCWRFNRPDLAGGGLGELEDLLVAYAAAGGRSLVRADIQFWEVLAHLRWAVIALEQQARHRSGQQRSLELALTGRLVPRLLLGALDEIAAIA